MVEVFDFLLQLCVPGPDLQPVVSFAVKTGVMGHFVDLNCAAGGNTALSAK